MDLLQDLKACGAGPLVWTNMPAGWEPLGDGGLRVMAPPKTDYFQNPDRLHSSDSAPYLWLPVEGDFVTQIEVRPAFDSTYDAGALMVRQDERHWAKLCFEYTDFGTHAIVSVVTDGVSDDANGPDIKAPAVWLQIVRVGNLFGLHYALDGQNWRMVRYFRLDMEDPVQVGLVAQSPVGGGTTVDFGHWILERRSVENLRAGK